MQLILAKELVNLIIVNLLDKTNKEIRRTWSIKPNQEFDRRKKKKKQKEKKEKEKGEQNN